MISPYIPHVIALCFLLILSILDLKTYNLEKGGIPSVLTIMFLIVMFVAGGVASIPSIIFAGLFAWLMLDLNIYFGLADAKVLVASAMAFPTMIHILFFILTILVIGFLFKAAIRLWARYLKKEIKEVPFIPVIFMAHILTFALFIL